MKLPSIQYILVPIFQRAVEMRGSWDSPRQEVLVSSGSGFETSTVLVFKEKDRVIGPEARKFGRLTLSKRKRRAGFLLHARLSP